MVEEITSQGELDDILDHAGSKLVVIEFGATWCGPCRMMGPVLDKLAKDAEYKGRVLIYKVDVDEASDLAEDVGIQCMPTFVFYQNSEKVEEMAGANKEKLLEIMNKYK